jgi:glycosyltransferase involved in cell wall biosynthesis
MITAPAITVLMPVYNGRAFIAAAIESVLRQTFTDFELLIVDDGSTDDTLAVIARFDDPRIQVLSQQRLGVAGALNTGIAAARADIIARFDADDICLPQRLAIQYAFLQQHPDHILVGADVDYIDAEGEYVFTCRLPAHTDTDIRALPYIICPFIHSVVMYRRAAVLEAGGYVVAAHGFEDHLLWHRLLPLGSFANLTEVLLQVRLNPGSVTMDDRWMPQDYLRVKAAVLRNGAITPEQAQQLPALLKEKHPMNFRMGAYYALLAKKYLWNNHQPRRARRALRQWLRLYPTHGSAYALYLLSFLPGGWIKSLYRRTSKSPLPYAD